MQSGLRLLLIFCLEIITPARLWLKLFYVLRSFAVVIVELCVCMYT